MNLESIRQAFPTLPNQAKFTFEEIHNRPLSPKQLNKQTYFEIFNSKKESMKKPINFMNYSNMNYDVINNDQMSNPYTQFLTKRVDNENQLLHRDSVNQTTYQFKPLVKALRNMDPELKTHIMNERQKMRLNMKSHILKNIRKFKDKSHNSSILNENSIQCQNSGNKSQHKQNKSLDKLNQGVQQKEKRMFNVNDFYKVLESSEQKKMPVVYNSQRCKSMVGSRVKNDAFTNKEQKSQREENNNFETQEEIYQLKGNQYQIQDNVYQNIQLEESPMFQTVDINSQTSKAISKQQLLNNQFPIKKTRSKSNLTAQNLYNFKAIQSNNEYGDIGVLPPSTKQNVNQSQKSIKSSEKSQQNQEKRIINLEKYIKKKRSQKDKEYAYSHASEVLSRKNIESKKDPSELFSDKMTFERTEEQPQDDESEMEDDDSQEQIQEENSPIKANVYEIESQQQQQAQEEQNKEISLKKVKAMQKKLQQEKKRRKELEKMIVKLKSDLVEVVI